MKLNVFNRRTVFKGLLGGASVGVAIPMLDAFLDTNGTALADGTPMPTRFATYFWGLGLTPKMWTPSKIGANYDVPPELKFLEGGLRDKVSIFSGFTCMLDGKANHPHWAGVACVMTGQAPTKVNSFDKMASFDTAVADQIGRGTRFRSIECTPYPKQAASYSTRGDDNFKTADASPLALYERIFGAGFHDPNSGEWKPDPKVMVKKSVLSAVQAQRQALMRVAGASDKSRLDQYFTSIRELEQKLDAELTPPAPCEACVVPLKPEETQRRGDVPTVNRNNAMMSKLTAMAMACNQTNVVNYVYTSATSELYRTGDTNVYHQHTHEEAVDAGKGYQPISQELAQHSVNGFGEFLKAMDEVKEGDGTLLDHALVLGYSDTGWAKIHSVDNIPIMLAGGANGRHKGGQHYFSSGDAVTRISLTAQQLVGMPIGSFGSGSMKTAKPISEVMA